MSVTNAAADLQAGLGEVYDALSDQFQSGVTVYLARVNPSTDDFEILYTVASKRFWEYSNYRQNTLLEIAEDNATITGHMSNATHVFIDTDVYTIRQGDTLPPSGTNPVWQLFLDLYETDKQYTRL